MSATIELILIGNFSLNSASPSHWMLIIVCIISSEIGSNKWHRSNGSFNPRLHIVQERQMSKCDPSFLCPKLWLSPKCPHLHKIVSSIGQYSHFLRTYFS